MPNGIQVTLAGNVATTPVLRTTPSGVVADFRLASSRRRHTPDKGWVAGPTSFLTVTCWRTLAEHTAASLQKGDPVVVSGSLSVRDRDVDGRTVRDVELTADAVGHDLTFGTSVFARSSRSSAAERDGGEESGVPAMPAAAESPGFPSVPARLPHEVTGGLPQAVAAQHGVDPAPGRAA
jgi:single-strand DNA-binding protein